jgi:hypothetical protein
MIRTATQLTLMLSGFALLPAVATAQFRPALVPPNPLYQHPAYRFQFNLGASVPTAFGRTFVGVTVPFTRAPQFFSPNYGFPMPYHSWQGPTPTSTGYMSAGSGRYDSSSAQRDFMNAQREATQTWGNLDAAKNMISDQWAYEKVGVAGMPAAGPGKDQGDLLLKALTATQESEVASGEALNQILTAITVAESKGGKGVAAFLPPQLLDEIRFTGATGDLVNLVRQSGRYVYPTAFAGPELRDLRDMLDKDFAAVANTLIAGKPIDPNRLMKLELTLKRFEEIASPIIRNQSFEDAIDARRFLNQFGNAVRAMKGSGMVGVVNPNWSSEGTNVAELARHMAKYKLRFGPAPQGSESAYLALHRGFVTYLFVLSQPKK